MEIIPEEMSLAEVKEQLALYTRLYYNLRKNDDTDYAEKKRVSANRYARKKRLEKLLNEGKAEIDNDGNIIETPTETSNKKYPISNMKTITKG